MQKKLEQLWREEKYRVMFHSQYHYNQIRAAMRDQASFDVVSSFINDALKVPPSAGSQRNALQHMWGYFKKQATVQEKERYRMLLEQQNFSELLQLIAELAERYQVHYLLQSTIVILYIKR